jgi:hypothetical protein
MARGRVQGPRFKKLRGRALNRNLLSQGIVRRRTGKGTFVDLDVSPLWTAVADGVAAAAAEQLADATSHAPDDETTPGSRIQDSGIWGVYGFGGLLETGGPGEWRKPRSFRPQREGIDAVISFKSGLHHLHELGTVYQKARPYLGPARLRMADRLPAILAAHFPKGGPDA